MKVKEVIQIINDIEQTQRLIEDAKKFQDDTGHVCFKKELVDDIDEKLEALKELYGIRELK